VSLRTYQLITHPAFLSHVEASRLQLPLFPDFRADKVPEHRPDIQNLADIARYIGISPLTVRGLIIAKHKHYRSFEFRKRAGGTRQIDAPRTYMKVVQWWILDTVLASVEPSAHAFGFVKNRSFVDNARFHLGARHVLNLDIKDFFPSIDERQVERIFGALGYRPSIARCLANLTTFGGVLPQGAPTSPSLANIRMLEPDGLLNEIASDGGLRFSRYADDLTFSSAHRIPAELVQRVQGVLSRFGFCLNTTKTRFMGANQRKEVTGLILGADDVALPRDFLNAARGWFYRAKISPAEYVDHLERIRGTLAHVMQVGGRGSEPIIELGRAAVQAIETRPWDVD